MSGRDLVQLKNPRTGYYTLIDRGRGQIVDHGRKIGEPFPGVPIVSRREQCVHGRPSREV